MSENTNTEFSPEKSHPENLQVSINKILGQDTGVSKIRKSSRDNRKLLFCKIIDHLIFVNTRSFMMTAEFDLSLDSYENAFFDTIDFLLELNFNQKQIRTINFFLYDRFNDDGTITPLQDNDGSEIPLACSEDLYNVIVKLDDVKNKRKNTSR